MINRNYVKLENLINFECFENFPNSGCMSLIFPIRKALGPLPKIAKKNLRSLFGCVSVYMYLFKTACTNFKILCIEELLEVK